MWVKATDGGSVFGGTRLKARVAKAVNGCVEPMPAGRPAKKRRDKRQLVLL